MQPVSVFVAFPTASDQIAGRQVRDLAEDLFRDICRSILFKKFSTGLFNDLNNPLQFVSHGTEVYNTAFYIHRYSFEQVADLYFQDTVGFDEDVAFRDISLSIAVDPGTGENPLTAEIDLDDNPL